MTTRLKIFLGVLIALLLTAGATWVWAHGGDPDLVHSCVRDITGVVRIVDPNSNCLPSEHALDWSKSAAGGISDLEVVTSSSPFVEIGAAASWTPLVHSISCPPGKKATGGGASVTVMSDGNPIPAIEHGNNGFALMMNGPQVVSGEPIGWTAAIHIPTGDGGDYGPHSLTVYAICVTAIP